MKSKFLVLYPSPENLDQIIKKANVQNAKNGPFSAVVLLGSCLPAEMPATVPDAPTYFFGKSEQEGSFIDVGTNFTCVKSKSAVLKLESGITVAFFNDTLHSEEEPVASTKADVLFTYNWPYCIATDQRLSLVGDRSVDEIVKKLQPRYHFAAGSEMGKVYEHKTVAWTSKRSYRFISLAREGTGNKWFYAFGIEVGDDEVSSSVSNPFLEEVVKRPREDEEVGPEPKQLKLDSTLNSENTPQRMVKVVAPSECFFCLSNPKLEAHMIVSIGKSAYLTIAKGPLTRPNRYMDFSGHAIIIPIDHSPTLSTEMEVSQEIEKYQQTLADAFATNGYDVVFYEISRPENVHYHIQMVPVARGIIGRGFDAALEDKSRFNNVTFEHNSKLDFKKYTASESEDLMKATESGRFIKFTVFSEKTKTFYVAPLEEKKGTDLQFPRRVLAFLLRLPKRVKWDRCMQSQGQEIDECSKFKRFYEKFDFTR